MTLKYIEPKEKALYVALSVGQSCITDLHVIVFDVSSASICDSLCTKVNGYEMKQIEHKKEINAAMCQHNFCEDD